MLPVDTGHSTCFTGNVEGRQQIIIQIVFIMYLPLNSNIFEIFHLREDSV